MPFSPLPNFVNVRPTNGSANTSATYVMAGFGVAGAGGGWTITPSVTGRILLCAMGIQTAGATAVTCTLQLSFGTGTAPAANAAVTGTQQGAQPAWVSLTGTLSAPFALFTILQNQALGTALWFDIAQKSSSSTLTLTTPELIAIEF